MLAELLERHGRTFADEAGIRLRDTPAPLFQLLVLSSLLSANTTATIGLRAAAAVRTHFPTAARLADAGDDERWRVLADARSLRKQQNARQLGQLARAAQEDYRGDLRRLRERAGDDPGRVRELLQGFTGVGEVGADIFCREAQAVWPALRPFADGRVLDAAASLGLPDGADGLARLVGTDDLSVVGAALVRTGLDDDAGDVRDAAG